jgi:hypothetical protein
VKFSIDPRCATCSDVCTLFTAINTLRLHVCLTCDTSGEISFFLPANSGFSPKNHELWRLQVLRPQSTAGGPALCSIFGQELKVRPGLTDICFFAGRVSAESPQVSCKCSDQGPEGHHEQMRSYRDFVSVLPACVGE